MNLNKQDVFFLPDVNLENSRLFDQGWSKLIFEKFNTELSNYQTPCSTSILSAQCLEIIKKVTVLGECQTY